MPPDGGLSWFRRSNPDVVTVLAVPSLAKQRSSRSDLSPQWFDKVPVLSSAALVARRMSRNLSNASSKQS